MLFWVPCCWNDFQWQIWHFSSSVMMRDHGNREVVRMWEQLMELFEAQVIKPAIRTQIQMSRRTDVKD